VRYELVDYQREAATEVLQRLGRGNDDWTKHRSASSFALSAITGSGKTVIATAVIEAMLHGSSDLGVEADPKATFLWFTDDPSLNRQTRGRMLEASDLLAPSKLTVIDRDFLDQELQPGRVYFLNNQKLSKGQPLVQSGTNLRQVSFWEILANTIGGERAMLYLVLDEAHRGMKRTKDRGTIVQRVIAGERGSNPPMPVVWGISATIDRFTAAMKGIADRTTYPAVQVDIDKVRASGLVKDEIGLAQPDEKGTFSTTLLRDATRRTLDFQSRWAAYSVADAEPEVRPVMVVQVPDKASTTKLGDIVEVIESEWPGLGPGAVAHVFGEHEPIDLDTRRVDWVHPESIQTDRTVRVVLAKQAISTGWDCPRAEVLYSERPAKDATHIAQVIGRMVRSPLARRIATDDVLNSVACYLPLFDRKTLDGIKAELEGNGRDPDAAVGAEVVRAPAIFGRNPFLDPAVFDFVETLPSIPTPDSFASPLRRAKTLARLLADDVSGSALLLDAGKTLTKRINLRLDGLAVEQAEAVAAGAEDLRTTNMSVTIVDVAGAETGAETTSIATHYRDIDRDARRLINSIKEGVGRDYYAHRVSKEPDVDKLDVRIEVAALLGVDGVVAEIEATATKYVQEHLAKSKAEIKNTTGATRDAYRKVEEQTSLPEKVDIELRDNELGATKDAAGDDLPTFTGHLYAGADGTFPARLNDWETTVIETEIARPSFVAWYRNPSRATANALRIAYQDDTGKWSSLQVDFLVISKKADGTYGASIVDPHGTHLADAKAKLRALATFADRHGDQFVRIESIVEVGGDLRSLDLLSERVRKAIADHTEAKITGLYEGDHATDYQ
jgi:hypothetical protein